MNSYLHAVRSVAIFGEGSPESYLPIHQTIDLNKVVDNDVRCRFLLHHFDVGGNILWHIFGDTVPGTNIKVREVLYQHLFEDYGQIPSYLDWLEVDGGVDVTPRDREMLKFVRNHKLFDQLEDESIIRHLEKIHDIVSLKRLTRNPAILEHKCCSYIFATRTGLELLKRIIRPETEIIDDLTTVIMMKLFGGEKENFALPAISDLKGFTYKWMLRPDGPRMSEAEVKVGISMIRGYSDPSLHLGVSHGKERHHGPMKWEPVPTPAFEPHQGGCGGGVGEGLNMVVD